MQRLLKKSLVLLVSLFIFGSNGIAQKSEVINSEVFQKAIQTENTQIIDVRTSQEYASGHIENALNYNIFEKDFKLKAGKLDKRKPIYVYCKSGGRSARAASILKSLGFKEIYDLSGGITAWKRNQLPVVR